MNFRNFIYGFGVLVVVSLVIWGLYPRAVSVETAKIYQGEFKETLRSDGKIRATQREVVTAFASGDIKKIDLKVGDKVTKGQVLTTLMWDFDKKIVAPIEGIITQVFKTSAGPVQRGEPLLEIAKIDKLEVSLELLTSDAVRVKLGATVEVEGWGGEPFVVHVSKVSKAGYTKVSALGVEEERTEIIAAIKNPPANLIEKLGDNFHVECNLTIATHPNSLIAPIGAIFREGDGWAVYRIEEGRAQMTSIQIQNRNSDEVQIIAGLKENDEVIVYPGDIVKNGLRVKSNQN